MSYSGLTTKIRAMQSHLLNVQNFREIVELEGVPQAVNYLKDKPSYGPLLGNLETEDLHRGQIERLLKKSIYRDFAKLYRFSNASQRKFLDIYFGRYEVYFLKVCLTSILDHRQPSLDLRGFREFFDKHSKLKLENLEAASTVDEFLSAIKDSVYYPPLARLGETRQPTLFDYEMTLDLNYFRRLWENRTVIREKQGIQGLTKALGSKMDMLNIQWIYRCKKYYHMNSADIYALLIPVNYRLSSRTIQEMVEADSLETLESLIEKCYYAKHYREFTEERLETLYAEILKYILSSESRKHPYSVTTIYSYLYHKEHEVDRLIIALECVRYRIAPEEAMKRVACR